MKTLYLTDLDGTLLNAQSRLSECTRETLNGLIRQGMAFSYATARSFQSAQTVTQGLTLKLPVICHNGAFLVEPESGKILYSHTFSAQEVDSLRTIAERFALKPFVYSMENGAQRVYYLPWAISEGGRFYLSSRQGDPRMRPVDFEKELFRGEVFYFSWIGEYGQLSPLAQVLEKDDRFHCVFQQELYREEYWLEVMPRRATKAEGAKLLKQLCGCERLVCFGDRANDISMFRAADEAYAVAGSPPELTAFSTGILKSNDKDAVAEFLLERSRICPSAVAD